MENNCGQDFQVCCNSCEAEIKTNRMCQCQATIPTSITTTTATTAQFKLPVRIATIDVPVIVEDNIKIPGGFSDIKKIKRRVILTQCYLLENNLFVQGYVRKDIQYVVPECMDGSSDCCSPCECVRNTYNDVECKVKFSCVTQLPADVTTVIPATTISNQAAFLYDCMSACDSGIIGESACERRYTECVPLNEPVRCELDRYNLIEGVILREDCDEYGLFGSLTEKFSLTLRISLFQNRHIEIPGVSPLIGIYECPIV